MIRKELDVKVNEETYYPDSKVVLGYIQNESRRFYVYVANHVQTIHNATDPSQWRYIDTAINPADLATLNLFALFSFICLQLAPLTRQKRLPFAVLLS